MLDIIKLQRQPLAESECTAPAHLHRTGDAGFDGKAAALMVAVQAYHACLFRARTDEAHIAAQHIVELGRFVQAGAAQDAATRC